MVWWKNLFNRIMRKIGKCMSDLSFIPRREDTKKIDTTRLTHAYVLETSDGIKVAIALKIDGVWVTIPYDPALDKELSIAMYVVYSIVLIDDWARILHEYSNIIDLMDEKVKQAAPKKSKNNTLG